MKKPEITKGEWEIVKAKTAKFGIRSDKGFICFMVDADGFESWENYLHDARAISAVPEMIDALIKARECYQGVGDFEACGEMMSQIIPEIDNALKKAGCTE